MGEVSISDELSLQQVSSDYRIPVRDRKLPLPNILFFSGTLVERMILSTTLQLSNVPTSPTASAIISSAAERERRILSEGEDLPACTALLPASYRYRVPVLHRCLAASCCFVKFLFVSTPLPSLCCPCFLDFYLFTGFKTSCCCLEMLIHVCCLYK